MREIRHEEHLNNMARQGTPKREDLIHKAILTLEDGKRFVEHLHSTGRLFHFEDDPSGIIDDAGKPVFTASDAQMVDERIVELYALKRNGEGGWGDYGCPIGYALHVMEESQ